MVRHEMLQLLKKYIKSGEISLTYYKIVKTRKEKIKKKKFH